MVYASPLLLNDEQMRTFITEGYLILKADFPREFHQRLVEQLNLIYDEEGNPGNNLLPRIPALQKAFDHPVITGALTSVLGPNYLMHTHRHGHFNASPKPGGWHKDSYWGYQRIRNHHPWWAMIMYFPQDTPIELGPTGVMPGTQTDETRTFSSDNPNGEALASGEAGTFALIHYDIWHRSTANVLGQPRYMLKFEFMRTEAPQRPAWDCREPEWQRPASFSTAIPERELLWRETWNWLSGQVGSLADTQDPLRVAEAAEQLQAAYEPDRLNAAYELAGMGSEGIAALLQALDHENARISRNAAYGLSVAGAGAVAGLTGKLSDERPETAAQAAFALGELREASGSAVPKLVDLLDTSPSVFIRQSVVEALGLIQTPQNLIVSALSRSLSDPEPQVRFTAGLALLRMGGQAEAAIPALEQALEDENRYVRGHAAEALHYIGTPSAKDILIRFLLQSRWCPDTTKASTF